MIKNGIEGRELGLKKDSLEIILIMSKQMVQVLTSTICKTFDPSNAKSLNRPLPPTNPLETPSGKECKFFEIPSPQAPVLMISMQNHAITKRFHFLNQSEFSKQNFQGMTGLISILSFRNNEIQGSK